MSAPQNGEALRDLEDLLELVGDEEDGDAAGLEVANDVEEGAHLLLRQGGGGLVHDDEPGVAYERAADGDQLLVGDGEVADRLVQVDGEADLGDGFRGDPAHARAVDQGASGGNLAAERDILHDGEVGEDGEVLVDDAHADGDGVCGRQVRVFASRDGHASGIRGVDAGDDLDEGGFARPVFAGQAVDFSGRDLEVDVDQGSHAGEGFADVSHRQHRGVHVGSFPRVVPSRPVAVASVSGCPASASFAWKAGAGRVSCGRSQKPRESTLSWVILSQPFPSRTLVDPGEKCMFS